MTKKDNISEIKIGDQKIVDNKELNIWEALIPVFALVTMLFYTTASLRGFVFAFLANAISPLA